MHVGKTCPWWVMMEVYKIQRSGEDGQGLTGQGLIPDGTRGSKGRLTVFRTEELNTPGSGNPPTRKYLEAEEVYDRGEVSDKLGLFASSIRDA